MRVKWKVRASPFVCIYANQVQMKDIWKDMQREHTFNLMTWIETIYRSQCCWGIMGLTCFLLVRFPLCASVFSV